jgi:Tol biopolymer transport system component
MSHMTRRSFVIVVLAVGCAPSLASKTWSQSSATAPVWHIGQVAIQADDEWVDPSPLEFERHIRGSGAVIQRRIADHIVFADSPGSQQRRLGIGLEPALSPDGNIVVYCGVIKPDQPGRQLIEVKPGTHEQSQLTNLAKEACDPAWSPDGSKIAFNTESSQGGVVAVLDLDGSKTLAISPGARPRWSPDGKKLVFLRWPEVAGGPNSIWIVNADGTGLKKVSDIHGLLPSASWGEDGASIIFTNEDQHRSAIFRIQLDGSNLEKIAGDKNFDMYFPSISPDGKELAVIADSDKAPTLTLIDLNTRKSRVLCKALRASFVWVKNQ